MYSLSFKVALKFSLAAILQIFAISVYAQNCVDSQSRAGDCLSLAACPHLMEEFYDENKSNTYATDFQTYMSESICGYDGSNFLICCSSGSSAQSASTGVNSRPPRQQPSQYPQTLFHFTSLGQIGGITVPVASSPISFYPYPAITNPTASSNAYGQPTILRPVQSPSNIIYQPAPVQSITVKPASTVPYLSAGCGISRGATNRVVGGVEAKRGTYPWIAALAYRDEFGGNNIKFLCAGSLVSKTYVVTSAHCINSKLAMARLGAHDLANPYEPDAMDFGIKRAVVHENFDLKSIQNDIAMVELSSPAPNTNFIGTICLPENANFLRQDFVGMNPFVAGWGAIKFQGPTSNVLRDVQVPIVPRQVCEQSYRSVFQFVEFSDKLICAGNTNVDACQGDSGGPLMLPQLEGNSYRYFLLGIVSYGYECARSGFPGVYTRIASYVPWIKRQMV